MWHSEHAIGSRICPSACAGFGFTCARCGPTLFDVVWLPLSTGGEAARFASPDPIVVVSVRPAVPWQLVQESPVTSTAPLRCVDATVHAARFPLVQL